MPSTFDNTYHYRHSAAVYDSEADKKTIQNKRVFEEILEQRTPPVPTQQDENEYMDFLEESFRSDPWLHYRFRKYMAGPKRIPWKNAREIQSQYRVTFVCHWMLGSALFWPFAVLIGRRAKHNRGGVPVYPVQRFVEDWPRVEPTRIARKAFAWWSIGSSLVAGYLFAKYWMNDKVMSNDWYNRPDLKPYPAMVKSSGERDITYETMKSQLYIDERRKQNEIDRKKSAWYRYFFPLDADWNVKENPYAHYDKNAIFNLRKPRYQTSTNDFGEHLQR